MRPEQRLLSRFEALRQHCRHALVHALEAPTYLTKYGRRTVGILHSLEEEGGCQGLARSVGRHHDIGAAAIRPQELRHKPSALGRGDIMGDPRRLVCVEHDVERSQYLFW
jgi:hypothetical protein